MDNNLLQWFSDAAGFSGTDLSLFIRMLTFLLTVVFCAIVVKGMIAKMSEEDTPLAMIPKLVMLLVFAVAMNAVLYV
jgi:hypothetical protein